MPPAVAQSKQVELSANADTAMPSLSEMQASFQRSVLLGDSAVLSEILDNSRTDRSVLFGVYRHAYFARLVEVVRNDHPLLYTYLGDAAFDQIARAYIAARPSQNQNARWFSHLLPEYLTEAHPFDPQHAELASLERALNDAFDAPDREPLVLSDLALIPPEDWSGLVFAPHPSARLIDCVTNAHAIWLAVKSGKTPPLVEIRSERESILVWRQDTTPKLRCMLAEEAMMWKEAIKGVPFGDLCELVAIYDDPETAPLRSAQHLQGWIVSGLLGKITSPN
ncbi:MAG: putative DNA-binding domain-containing protein [Proteobacteria bacterium]|nr:putative DNA-binding domain-containing protein [Pseudomonadota bacterium]